MKQITLRLPEIAYEKLSCLSKRHGVSFRAIFEAAAIISFHDEFDPERRATQLELWAVAGRLERSPHYREGPKRMIVARLDDALAEKLDRACERHGVSRQAALALVVMPWPEEDTETFHCYRAKNLDRIINLARELDFQRRTSG